MRLGVYFTLDEMVATDTNLLNEPYDQELINLTRLVTLTLDPIREDVGPLRVTSGYRSEAVNQAVGGVSDSYHTDGLAADVQHIKLSARELFNEIKTWFEYAGIIDKCILEFDRWVHIQIAPIGEVNRNEFLIAEKVNGKTQYREA